jgi:hypothetical protein
MPCTILLQVVDSDGFMNISLEDVVMLDPAGNSASFKSFHVQGRLVRYGTLVSRIPAFLVVKFLFIQ